MTYNGEKKKKDEVNYSNLTSEEQDYILSRLDIQIKWYDDKCKNYKLKFQFLSISTIVLSSFITLLSASCFKPDTKTFIASTCAVFITIFQGVLSLNKYNENWVEYRTVCETLKKEKYMFIMRSGVYFDKGERFQFFVERIETIISQENVNWAGLIKENKERKSNGT